MAKAMSGKRGQLERVAKRELRDEEARVFLSSSSCSIPLGLSRCTRRRRVDDEDDDEHDGGQAAESPRIGARLPAR